MCILQNRSIFAKNKIMERRCIKNKIREHRGRLRITQAQLATHTGVSIMTIQGAENGLVNTSLYTALLIAEALEVPIGEIFCLET